MDYFSDEELSEWSTMDFDLPNFSLTGQSSQPGAALPQSNLPTFSLVGGSQSTPPGSASPWHTEGSYPGEPMSPPRPPQPEIPKPTFETPPKLRPIEDSLKMVSGTDIKSLRLLAVKLACDSIFGEEELGLSSLSGRHNTKVLDSEKLKYIKQLIYSRLGKSVGEREFKLIWKDECLKSISKECQRLRMKN